MSIPTFSHLVLFGDSDTDGGEGAHGVYELSGHTWPSALYFNGRFCNGPVWPEYFAASLGIVYIPSENYAVGGARTDFTNVIEDEVFTNSGFIAQIQRYVQTHPKVDSEALFVVWGGGNNFYKADLPNKEGELVDLAMRDFDTAIRLLLQANARHILMGTLPSPAYYPSCQREDEIPHHQAAKAFNIHLAAKVNNIRSVSCATITLGSIAELAEDVITNPERFGFTNTRNPCLVEEIPQGDASKYLFWDDVHFTTAFHKLIAQQFVQSIETSYQQG